MRYVTSLVLAVAVYIVRNQALAAIAMAAGVYGAMELMLWKMFLSSCKKKTGVERKSLTPCLLTGEEREPAGRVLYRGILVAVLGVLVIANAYDQGMTGTPFQLSLAIGVVCLIFAIVQLLKLFRRGPEMAGRRR